MAVKTTMTAEKAGLSKNLDQRIPQITIKDLGIDGIAKLKLDPISDKTVILDKKKAAEYIDLPIFAGEREIADSNVQFLYDEMRKKTFNETLVTLATAVLNGVTYKINGQHTCWAVVYMPDNFSMQVREVRFRVANEEQLKLLYSTFDRAMTRSDTHMSKVFLIGTPAAENLWSSMLSRLVSGFKFWHSDDETFRKRASPEQVAALIARDYSQLFNRVGLYIQAHSHELLAKRVPVIAAVFATFDKVSSKAPEFWNPVISGIELPSKADARYQLRETLLNAVQGGGKFRGSTSKRLLGAEDQYRITLLAWNKWRKGETLKTGLRTTKERATVQ
jgi:hypothetical protein